MRWLALLGVLVATLLVEIDTAAAGAPTITGLSPTHGSVGTVVKITGSGFAQGVTKVFFGTEPAIEKIVLSSTSMQATAPDGTPTLRHIVVKTDAGSAQSPVVFTLSPTITSSLPNTSPVGVTVKIRGGGLGETTAAVFAGNAAGTIAAKAAGEVDIVVPDTARTGNLKLTTPGGTAAIPFHVVPRLGSVTAVSQTVGGAVTITGTGLASVDSVNINGGNASFHIISANEIHATIPADASPTGSVNVHGPSGSATSYSFHVVPTISGFSPASSAVGATVTIGGTGFGNSQVLFRGGSTGTITSSSHTWIKVTVPSGALVGPIRVTTQGGTATSAGKFRVVPKITSVSPNTWSTGGTVTVFGSGLGETSAAVFAGAAAGTIVSTAPGEVHVGVPSMARTGNLTLTTPGGTASVLFHVKPNVTGVATVDRHTVGSTVTISGSGLASVDSVNINGASASFHVDSPLQIRATIPADAYPSGDLEVRSSSGSSASHYFHVAPTISGFSPATAAAGDTITIGGTGFGALLVRFPGGSTGIITASSHTMIKVTVPNGATTGPITVTTPGGSATTAGNLIISPDFSLSVAPASQTASRGGKSSYTVTIKRTNGFSGSVQLNVEGLLPGLGGRVGAAFSPNPVPAGGTTATLTVTTDTRTAAGTYTVTITGTSGSLKHTVQVSLTVQ